MRVNCQFAFLVCLISFVEFPYKSYEKQLFLGKYPIKNKKTESPINIITKKTTIEVKYPPLILKGILTYPVRLINTGNTVEMIREGAPCTGCHTTEGVFLDNFYIYEKTRFLWTNGKNETTGITIDGKGFPVTIVNYFYNIKYGTFKNSLNYRDGITGLIFSVYICSTPNKSFFPFSEALRKVLNAGSSTTTQLGASFTWYGPVPANATYYAYPGAYHDLETNKKYYSETEIVVHYPELCISKQQYATTFGSMKDLRGKPYTSTENPYPFRQPVVKGYGVIQTCRVREGLASRSCG